MNSKHYIKQSLSFAVIVLLFTCLLGLKQDYKPIADSHHFDASITELALEFEVEEQAQDDSFTPDNIDVVHAYFVLSEVVTPTPYESVSQSLSYSTPLTRAPPLA